MDNKFSIVIPYHAEASTIDFARRQVHYYHVNPTPMMVILAVSGDEMVKTALEEFIKTLNDSRFIVFTINEGDITNKDAFLQKLLFALKSVTTPYVVINGADDVIIPEKACKGIEILAKNADIAAVKGYTIFFDCKSGAIDILKDSANLDDDPIQRVKEAIKDRDSIYYIIRRTTDLVREYENIINLSKKSTMVRNSLYHIEHCKALSAAALGKIYVFNTPWRLCNSHLHNSSSHTESSFIRVEFGCLDKVNYEWFQSVNSNMRVLSYPLYKFLWECHQIRGISVTLKQIIFHFLYKNCSLNNTTRIFIYFVLNKIYMFFKKIFCNKSTLLKEEDKKSFFKTAAYLSLKKHYFSEQDIKLIESKE